MDYVILDNAGNVLASFVDEWTARATLHAMVKVEPDAADHVVLLAYDATGMPVGEALSVVDVPPPVTVDDSPAGRFLQPASGALIRLTSRHSTSYFGFVTAPSVRTTGAPVPA